MYPPRSIGAAVAAVLCLHLPGCASLPSGGGQTTSFDRAVQNCIGAVAMGTIGGAVLGGIAGGGSRNMGRGAVVGAAAGGVVCAVMMAVANEEDKARVLANERAAVAGGFAKSESYSRDGVTRRVDTKVYNSQNRALVASAPPAPPAKKAAPKPAAKPAVQPQQPTAQIITAALPTNEKLCRFAETTIEVEGQGTTTTDKQLYCRTAAGDWEPAATET